eukprot:TRINITY_DN111805_c0_g1_i1.p1 TRINITY_DN111805_c0_g1~~TRINITY_DN111805_c0_g1_i1.p1  ORF type:complete len:648 (-),score=169.98 TRINITY_DN111805_c0_g1_i1:76-2019(-)
MCEVAAAPSSERELAALSEKEQAAARDAPVKGGSGSRPTTPSTRASSSSSLLAASSQPPTAAAAVEADAAVVDSTATKGSGVHSAVVNKLSQVYETIKTGFGNDFVEQGAKHLDQGNFQYGEVTYSGMEALYKALRLGAGDVFYDLGSGTGKLVLYVALRGEVAKSVGIEAGERRAQQAAAAFKKLRKVLNADPEAKCAEFDSQLGDIRNPTYQDATVVAIANLCMDAQVISRTVDNLLRCPHIRRVASIVPLPNQSRLKVARTAKVSCTWAKICGWTVYDVLPPQAKLERSSAVSKPSGGRAPSAPPDVARGGSEAQDSPKPGRRRERSSKMREGSEGGDFEAGGYPPAAGSPQRRARKESPPKAPEDGDGDAEASAKAKKAERRSRTSERRQEKKERGVETNEDNASSGQNAPERRSRHREQSRRRAGEADVAAQAATPQPPRPPLPPSPREPAARVSFSERPPSPTTGFGYAVGLRVSLDSGPTPASSSRGLARCRSLPAIAGAPQPGGSSSSGGSSGSKSNAATGGGYQSSCPKLPSLSGAKGMPAAVGKDDGGGLGGGGGGLGSIRCTAARGMGYRRSPDLAARVDKQLGHTAHGVTFVRFGDVLSVLECKGDWARCASGWLPMVIDGMPKFENVTGKCCPV